MARFFSGSFAGSYEATRVFAGSNRHAVIEGRVYRCSQPSANDLRDLVRSKGIRTVINLRGTAQNLDLPGSDWYRDEVRFVGKDGNGARRFAVAN